MKRKPQADGEDQSYAPQKVSHQRFIVDKGFKKRSARIRDEREGNVSGNTPHADRKQDV